MPSHGAVSDNFSSSIEYFFIAIFFTFKMINMLKITALRLELLMLDENILAPLI